MVDVEHGRISMGEKRFEPEDGFAAMARSLAGDPDHESFVFREFRDLGARMLLLKECQLVELERRQQELDMEVARSDSKSLHRSMRDWRVFEENALEPGPEGKTLELANKIDVKLEEYYKALLLQRDIAKLERPSPAALIASRIALLSDDHEESRLGSKLGGEAKHIFDDEDDLIALNTELDNDLLSKFLRAHCRGKAETSRHEHRIIYFSNDSLVWLVHLCSIAIAALFLIGPILALYFTTNADVKLTLVIVFIVLFAIGLNISTGASRDQIFAATAAYAAVLEVFVSGNLGNARSAAQT